MSRRLAQDHAALHKKDLPPYWLFPTQGSSLIFPDDLTQLTLLLTGPQGTPYDAGLWKVYFKIPDAYPANPPKAYFRTRIWHPNVEENSGSVCVDTLKRDWDSKLTLRDVLTTISCLLIQPNPDSALNAAAGHLIQEDFTAFARQARLMTSIHAAIPRKSEAAATLAKSKGEDTAPIGVNCNQKSPTIKRFNGRKDTLDGYNVWTDRQMAELDNTESEDDRAAKENQLRVPPVPLQCHDLTRTFNTKVTTRELTPRQSLWEARISMAKSRSAEVDGTQASGDRTGRSGCYEGRSNPMENDRVHSAGDLFDAEAERAKKRRCSDESKAGLQDPGTALWRDRESPPSIHPESTTSGIRNVSAPVILKPVRPKKPRVGLRRL